MDDDYRFPIPSQFDYQNKLNPKAKVNSNARKLSNHSGGAKSDYQAASEWTESSNLNKKVDKYT